GGQVAWAEAALPLVSITHLDNRNAENRTVWVTRHRPKIDRIACPWLIKRFIDSKAQFLYVEPAEVIDVADRFNAIAFDAEGALYTHQDNECTFDALLKAFKLNDKALNHLAQIIRGADTGNHDIAPQSAGLLAASLGFSRMYKNDNAQLEACLPLYDALYRWCRDATDEQHNDASHAH
ncbi:MAG: chromate resistance protein ChrB domain-containing protein, partial [Arenicellales bacterium]